MKRWSLYLVCLATLAATSATAQPLSICEDLRLRLADMPRMVGGSPEVRKYSSAITQQNLEIRKAQNDLRRYRCADNSIVVVDGDTAGFCQELATSLDRMRENIRNLTAMRDDAARSGMDDDLRDHLLASLDENGCNDEVAVARDPDFPDPYGNNRGISGETFIPALNGYQSDMRGYPSYRGAPSNISTVCVRTCDGGFFPLSSSAAPEDFQRDADKCARMCPGVETELFYRFLGEQETADMISASTGAPYSAMPNAFVYRNRPPGEKSSCTCNLSAYYEQMREKPAPAPQQGSITRIETKPPTSAAAAPVVPPAEKPYDPAKSTVRQVGPQFLANDQGNIDLKNPAVTGPQPQQQ
ncbi:DUF2865 domain-containing protein [Rhizobium sp. BK251]|uniref:DUF2865 domain-containing protein n=1 Tax=Rhizobium sp. BK251 TaxID=2512125 RepID=UPI00104F2CC2|nr:DUF2865 domain-containing protein [Rhizobium sp. BK251]TCL73495.1 uncharacterized protein DUF2865 [Rhizobium sp. BK251]